MAMQKPRTEFASALNQISAERGVEPEVIIKTIEEAMLAAYKKDYGIDEEIEYRAVIDQITGETRIYAGKKEVTPPGFGRIAAQVAKQVLLQKIREAEKSAVLEEYSHKLDTMINGMILRFEGPNIMVDIGKAEAFMPANEQVRTEKYHLNQRLALYVKDIQETIKGRQVIVSRADERLVEKLFKREVPEVASGAVEIRVIAREAGNRSKVAVFSKQNGVDPVGSCVGQKGVRVQAVIEELGGEKLDIIQFSDDPVKFITAGLAPADKLRVEIDEKKLTAIVYVPEDQLSLAIGKGGQNVRLAARLTGYKIDIKEDKLTKAPKKTTKTKKKK